MSLLATCGSRCNIPLMFLKSRVDDEHKKIMDQEDDFSHGSNRDTYEHLKEKWRQEVSNLSTNVQVCGMVSNPQ